MNTHARERLDAWAVHSSAVHSGDGLLWLERWFGGIVNEWDSRHGVEIHSVIEPPGWTININLHGTGAERRAFGDLAITRSEHDWLRCSLYQWDDEQGGASPQRLGLSRCALPSRVAAAR